ncbi:MAG: prephenate dehydrogenase [Pseudomonadales bacterium]
MKLAIVGVGLIGGSFALAARNAGLFASIVGVDRNPEHLAQAQQLGICDATAQSVPSDADAVLVALPSDHIAESLASLVEHKGLIFDVASVKAALLEDAARLPARYVPCHPIAGSERSGPTAASAELFTDHLLVITPIAQSNSADLATVSDWWQAFGARVQTMSAGEHDRLFARTSHLPHLVAFAYMQQIEQAQLAFAAGGFRDFSRIAASDPDMWTPILRMNRKAIHTELRQLQAALTELGEAVDAADEGPLRELLSRAQRRRRAFDEL